MQIDRQLIGTRRDPKVIAPEQEIQGYQFDGASLAITVRHDGYAYTVSLTSEDLCQVISFASRRG